MRGRLDDADATAHFGGLNLDAAAAPPGRPHHPDRLRHQLPRRPWSASICSRSSPASRSRSSTPASSATATRRSTATPSSSPSRSRARRPTRWPPCANRSARATRRWPCATSSAARIAREADGGVYLHAGPEIGVASTKAFTAQVAVLTMLALYLGRMRHLSQPAGRADDRASCGRMPDVVRQTLDCHDAVQRHRREVSPRQQLPLPGPAVPVPGGPGRRAEAEGDQLHPRRGLPGRRDEARPDRPGRREHAVGLPDAARRRSSTR